MKKIYKVQWTFKPQDKSQEAYFETQESAEEFKKELDAAIEVLSCPWNLIDIILTPIYVKK